MSDSDEEEITFRYGTPLQPIEEEEGPPRKKLLQDQTEQYAVDSHGRRRFHGAFTGGFSAGYGNSVGTPEGFTPATFKSTRSEKALHTGYRPEDFMDEEDRSEFGIAPRTLHTQTDFSGQKRTNQRRFHDGAIPGEPVLESLLRPVHQTAAVKILKSMGWRPGQGTGERQTADEKKKSKRQHKVYGCQLPSELTEHRQETIEEQGGETDSDSEFEYSTLFAPDDYEPYILKVKNDRFGLGYTGLSRHSVLGNLTGEYGSQPSSSTSHLSLKEKGRKVSIRGQAFGVGALEDDDDDIYAREDMSNYDFTLGGATRDVKRQTPIRPQSGVIEGFVKSSKPLPSVPTYPPPALPRDYQPTPRRSRFEHTAEVGRDQGLGRHELSAEARGRLLGETQLPKATESTTRTSERLTETTTLDNTTTLAETTRSKEKSTDLTIDKNEEDPIAKLLGRNVNFTSQKPPIEAKEQDFISISNSNQSNVFKPFASNPEKQLRYESYLRDKCSLLERDSGMDRLSHWERNREMVEFEQAAKLYKPLTGFMDDRFTHATEPDDATNPLQAVARSTHNRGLATQDQIDAAAKGFFGALTRTETQWRPDALVCKRFNVPDPFSCRPEPKKDERSKVSYSIFEYMETSIHNKESFSKEQSTFSGSKSVIQSTTKHIPECTKNKDDFTKTTLVKASTSHVPITKSIASTGSHVSEREETLQIKETANKRMTVAELFMKESQKVIETSNSEAVNETIEKFDKMELYKAIFLSDSEDEIEKPTPKDPVENDNKAMESYSDYIDIPKNIERNKSPPRGIFANIDFEQLNAWSKKSENNQHDTEPVKLINNDKSKEITNIKDKSVNIDVNETDIYGPKIPENLQKCIESTAYNTINLNKDEKERDAQFKPKFRSKNERQDKVIEINSSSSDSWVEADAKAKKHKTKKSKKHKSKHKKSKHKKKVK